MHRSFLGSRPLLHQAASQPQMPSMRKLPRMPRRRPEKLRNFSLYEIEGSQPECISSSSNSKHILVLQKQWYQSMVGYPLAFRQIEQQSGNHRCAYEDRRALHSKYLLESKKLPTAHGNWS